jgi:hypothetical protein
MKKKYNELCNIPSDINEHLPTLYKYACECDSILELGVRGCVSSWAFLMGKPKLHEVFTNNNGLTILKRK